MSEKNPSQTSGRLPITAYIRTKNESRMIEMVVKAAFQVADEVLVIDSGSTDGTVALAEALGARVVYHDWHGFGHQKNVAEAEAKHDWLLDLDADEIVTPAVAEDLRQQFARAPAVDVFSTPMAIVTPWGEVWDSFGHQKRTKLYNRKAFTVPAHEYWDQLKLPKDAEKGRLRAPLNHVVAADTEQLVHKINKSSSDGRRSAKKRPLWLLRLRIFFGFPFSFLARYIGEGFWRGGTYGFAYAAITSSRRWLRDVKTFEQMKLDEAAKKSAKAD